MVAIIFVSYELIVSGIWVLKTGSHDSAVINEPNNYGI